MSEQHDDIDWNLTTWEGSRREQLRRWCRLSLRERLCALEEMSDVAQHFANMRAQGRFQDLSSGVHEDSSEYMSVSGKTPTSDK